MATPPTLRSVPEILAENARIRQWITDTSPKSHEVFKAWAAFERDYCGGSGKLAHRSGQLVAAQRDFDRAYAQAAGKEAVDEGRTATE